MCNLSTVCHSHAATKNDGKFIYFFMQACLLTNWLNEKYFQVRFMATFNQLNCTVSNLNVINNNLLPP